MPNRIREADLKTGEVGIPCRLSPHFEAWIIPTAHSLDIYPLDLSQTIPYTTTPDLHIGYTPQNKEIAYVAVQLDTDV